MNNSKNFRLINDFERTLITDSISNISSKIGIIFTEGVYKFYILLDPLNKSQKKLQIYLISYNQTQLEKLKDLHSRIHAIGLYFGFINKGVFYLSLEGAEFLYKGGYLSDGKFIHMNKKGEKSVLYGNNILKNMVSKIALNLQKGDFLLILNDMNEILAIAHSKVESKDIEHLKPKDVIAFNLSDKGFYLRAKQ